MQQQRKSILIKDTTKAERIDIVKESLGFDGAGCDDIDMEDMYDDYIEGKRELQEINREFSSKNAGIVRSDRPDMMQQRSCR